MPMLQIQLLVIFSYFGRDLGYQSLLLSNRSITSIYRCFQGLSLVGLAVIGCCAGSRVYLSYAWVQILSPAVMCVFLLSVPVSLQSTEHCHTSLKVLDEALFSIFYFFYFGNSREKCCIYTPENENSMSISLTLKNIIYCIKTRQ